MDPKEYITSGMLESYALGTTTPEESKEVECMARIYPEVLLELHAVQQSLEVLAEKHRITPPASLKSKIFDAIDAEMKPGAALPISESKIISITPKSEFNYKMLAAACLALLLISSFGAIFLYRKNLELADNMKDLRDQQNEFQNEFDSLSNRFSGAQQQLAALNNAAVLPVPLKGLPIAPDAHATVYWNKNSSEVLLSVNNLPPPPPGKQYQLWAIVNAAPVDLGVFNIPGNGENAFQKMKAVEHAAAFAVTLEKAGGSEIPTMDQMYVIGTI